MKTTDYYCRDCKFTWLVLNTNKPLDGIVCPVCHGKSVMQRKPKQVSDRASYVRGQIFELNKEHCHGLTPEQVETILSIGDEYKPEVYSPVRAGNFIMPTLNDDTSDKPLLTIVLDDINSVPTVHYKGKEVTQKMRLMLDWKTDDDRGVYPTYILIEHHDTGINTKTIQHNDPFGSHA